MTIILLTELRRRMDDHRISAKRQNMLLKIPKRSLRAKEYND